MALSKSTSRTLLLFVLVNGIFLSCNLVDQAPIPPTATLTPTFTPTPSSTPRALPTLEGTPDTGWYWLQPGLERRSVNIYNEQNRQVESLYLLRLDPNQFRLDVAFHETPQNLENWQKETNALIVVNGGYFRIENERYIPNGLTVVDGVTFGSSYDSFAGMLAISDYGTELRWLTNKPYDPYEPLRAALQSFPVLVKPGGELGFPAQYEDNVKARRTVIGQDQEGRILFILAPRGYFTLHQLSVYLAGSDLHLDIALNLDGGPSSGIFLADPRETISSQILLPFVILIYPR
jgi:hypothetical protein